MSEKCKWLGVPDNDCWAEKGNKYHDCLKIKDCYYKQLQDLKKQLAKTKSCAMCQRRKILEEKELDRS